MPKMKTNKAAKKRFKVTATGKVLFRPTGHKHLMSSKSAKKRRHTRKWRHFTAEHDKRDVYRMVGFYPKRRRNPPPAGQEPKKAETAPAAPKANA